MKIKIRISGRIISATPINPNISLPSPENSKISPRGSKGIPPSAGRRIRNAVDELGPDATFSTILLDECPNPEIINRIRTHIKSDCVGVIEFGIQNGWHIHLVHLRSIQDAHKILSNYGRCHHEKVRHGGKTGWYLTKSIGAAPPSEYPKSWYFCSRDLGRDEIFYVDSTIMEVCSTGVWKICEFCLITENTFTTLAHLKKLPPWLDHEGNSASKL
jgi:hypothetical protein